MKKILLALSLSGLVEPAVAGNDVSAGASWNGFYGGAQAAKLTGTSDWYLDDTFNNGPWAYDGVVFGAFAGYNHQIGDIVVGGELSFMKGELEASDGSLIDNYLDAKLRTGVATGPVLFYGVVSYSSLDVSEVFAAPASDPLTGFGFGAGIEYKVSSGMFFGVEYLQRDLSGPLTYPSVPGWSVEASTSTVSARVGFSF